MQVHLLRILACPACGTDLTVNVFREATTFGFAEVLDGLLTCAKGHHYPVVNGVPRMLPNAFASHPVFRQEYAAELRTAGVAEPTSGYREDPGVAQVRQRFEFQWHQWGNEDKIFGKSLAEMRAKPDQ